MTPRLCSIERQNTRLCQIILSCNGIPINEYAILRVLHVLYATGVNADGAEVGFTVAHLCGVLTLLYFAFFLVAMPLVGWFERPMPRPASISAAVLPPVKSKEA